MHLRSYIYVKAILIHFTKHKDFNTLCFPTFRLSLKNVAYIGLRSVDPLEKVILKKFNVAAYGMDVSFKMMNTLFETKPYI